MALGMITTQYLCLKHETQELLKKDIPTALCCHTNAAIDGEYIESLTTD
jgi:hypothetical protein